MNIIQLTPGAGAMYCGGCLRDNALVAALRKLGHQALMVPLYLPLTLDEEDQSAGTPVFFGGINVYLEQKSALFRGAPGWLRDLFASRRLLTWAAGKAAKTRAADLGELTLSMLRGEAGNQARELEALIAWLKTQPKPDVLCLSNALLIGMARRLRSELRVPVACALQGEDSFLDALPESHRAACWQTMADRAAEVGLFIAPSRYFGDLMRERLDLPADRVRVVHNGINLDGYGAKGQEGASGSRPPCWASLRGCARRRGWTRWSKPTSFCGSAGAWGNSSYAWEAVAGQRTGRSWTRCASACKPAVCSVRWNSIPTLTGRASWSFLRSLSVFSVPARYGEAFGLYVIEAMAAGVPVMLPRVAAFPELIEATGGGVLCAAGEPGALAAAIEELLLNPARARALGEAGRGAVFERFSADAMARATLQVYGELAGKRL